MRKKIVTIGSSAGITVSPAELDAAGLAVGDLVDVTVVAGTLEIRPVNKYVGKDMDDLVAIIQQARVRT